MGEPWRPSTFPCPSQGHPVMPWRASGRLSTSAWKSADLPLPRLRATSTCEGPVHLGSHTYPQTPALISLPCPQPQSHCSSRVPSLEPTPPATVTPANTRLPPPRPVPASPPQVLTCPLCPGAAMRVAISHQVSARRSVPGHCTQPLWAPGDAGAGEHCG